MLSPGTAVDAHSPAPMGIDVEKREDLSLSTECHLPMAAVLLIGKILSCFVAVITLCGRGRSFRRLDGSLGFQKTNEGGKEPPGCGIIDTSPF